MLTLLYFEHFFFCFKVPKFDANLLKHLALPQLPRSPEIPQHGKVLATHEVVSRQRGQKRSALVRKKKCRVSGAKREEMLNTVNE